VHEVTRLVGINHVALEVGSVDDALAWYGQFFDVPLRGRGGGMAFVDMGDQLLPRHSRCQDTVLLSGGGR
jgi:hypothetical protein